VHATHWLISTQVPAKTRDWTNDYSHSLTFWAILACLVGRAAHVYPLSRQINKRLRKEQARRRSNSFSQSLATEDALGDPLGEEKREDRARLSPRAAPEEQQPATAGEIPPAMQHMLWFSGLRGS
jgi:hypothetical protein